MARGCAPLPELEGRTLDDVLPKLSPELFRPRVNPEPSSQPRGTILRQPTTELIEGRLCYLDVAVSDGSLTRVPQLRGATAGEAGRLLAEADLRIESREKSSGEPAGRVFEQRPDAGTEVPRRSTVFATVATPTEWTSPADAAAAAIAAAIDAATRGVPPRPPEPEPAEETCLPLPELAGQHVDDALRTLPRRYFRPRLSEEPSTERRGTILRQPTTAPIDGSLCYADIAISDGSLTQVPALYGATAEEAERALAGADLRIAIRESVSGEPAGRVFDQKPRAGDELPRQSTVAAIIAVPELFDVPRVVGEPYREALRRLEGFTVTREVVASRLPSGQVVAQDPRPPAQRPAGAEVRLQISDGSLVLVPPVERGTLESARAALGEVELRGEVEEQEGELAPGLVATQEPPAGAEVPRGSTVRLLVSTGLPVPDVVGRQLADAAALLGRFVVEDSTVPAREPEGQVIDQEPRPPARVAAGTVVQVSVSDGSQVIVPAVGDAPIEPPTDDTEPANGVDGDGPTWPRWLTYVVALLAGGGLFHAVRLRLRPPPAEPHVSARLESDLGSVAATDAVLGGPEIRVSARLDAGDCTVRLEGDSP